MDEEALARMAERELGSRPGGISAVCEGLLHETYELCYDQERYILQVSPDMERSGELSRGIGLYRYLGASDIPVPAVVTRTVRECDGNAYSIVERLPGTSAKDEISPERVSVAGQFLARIHGLRSFETTGWIAFTDGELSVRPFDEDGLKARVVSRTNRYATLMRKDGMETAGKRLSGVLDRLKQDLPESGQPVLCHNDYSPDNILFQNGELSGILDFDRAIAGWAQRDLVKAATAFWMHDPCADWEVRRTLYEAYREHRPIGVSFEQNEPLYRVETLAESVGGMLELGELSAYEKEFYTERLLESIDRLDR